jgi:glycine cleavage system H protein
MDPTDRRYTRDHEWIWIHGDTGTVGITDFAQRELGDIVFVELPERGRRVQKTDVLGIIESVKAVSEVYAPASGVVVEVNASLEGAPETLNRDPYGEGWLCQLRLSDPSELDGLMDAGAYAEFRGT